MPQALYKAFCFYLLSFLLLSHSFSHQTLLFHYALSMLTRWVKKTPLLVRASLCKIDADGFSPFRMLTAVNTTRHTSILFCLHF